MRNLSLITSTLIPFQMEKEKPPIFTLTAIAERPVSPFTEHLPQWMPIGCSSRSILIVDDTPEVRMFMRKGLEAYGYQCQEAADGIDALRQMKSRYFDVVLTDLNMPFLDGLGLAQHVREDSSLGNPIVLLMISSHTNMIAPLALAFGIQEILVKPCLPSDVDKIIRQQQDRFPWAA